MDKLDILKKAKEKVDALVAEKLRADSEDATDTEAFKMAIEMQRHDALVSAIEQNYTSPEELSRIFADAVSKINVQVPTISAPDVNIPKIEVPKAEVTVQIPEIKLPTINVPEPKVTVNVPEVKIPPFPEIQMPESMEIHGEVGLFGYGFDNPLPVQLRDAEGNPVSLPEMMSVASGGGGPRYVKINNTVSEPIPISGNITSTPGATYYASDAIGSVNIVQSIPLSVSVSGATGTIGVVTINPDGNPVYGGSSSGGGLTDAELRANPIPVTAPAVADTGNTTTTPLGNGGNFTGTAFDMNAYASWSVNVFADQASATNGFKIQWSDDGTNWDFTDQTTYVASVGNMVTFGRKARYVRVNYTNGTTPQGAFRVTAYAHPFAVRQTRKFVGNQLTDADTGQVVVAALQGHTTAGGGAWVDVKVKPSGALSVDATATDLDIRNLSSATDSVTIVPSGTQAVSGTFWQATQPVSGPLTDTQLRASAVPVSLASVPSHAVTNAGTFAVQQSTYSTSSVTSVAGSASSVQLLASTAERRGAYFYNDSTAIAYLKLGTTASTSSFTVAMAANSFYELPYPCYTGRIDCIWASAAGNMRITEIT